MAQRGGKSHRLFTSPPGLRERKAVGLVVGTCLGSQGQGLSVSHWQGSVCIFIEKSGKGEVIEGKPKGSHKSSATVTSLKFDLAGAAFHDRPFQIQGSLILVHVLEFGLQLFRIKESELSQLPHRTHDGSLA